MTPRSLIGQMVILDRDKKAPRIGDLMAICGNVAVIGCMDCEDGCSYSIDMKAIIGPAIGSVWSFGYAVYVINSIARNDSEGYIVYLSTETMRGTAVVERRLKILTKNYELKSVGK